MPEQQPGGGGVEDPREVRRVDPAPYAWLDGPSALRGALPLGVHVVLGGLFVALGLYGVVASWSRSRPAAWFFAVVALLGLYVVRMGVLRRAWRRRHPGVDPVAASSMVDGGPVAADGVGGTVWRWLLVLVCAGFALLGTAVLVAAVLDHAAYPLSEVVVSALVGGAFAAFGARLGLSLWRDMPRRSDEDAALGLPPSRWGGASVVSRTTRAVLAVLGAAVALVAAVIAATAVTHPDPADPVRADRWVVPLVLVLVAVLAASLAAVTTRRSLAVARARRARPRR